MWIGNVVRINKSSKESEVLWFQVSYLGADSLTLSLIPADVGKPTVKSERATVRNGTYQWETPVYETVKFNREPRTGKINERIYQILVSNVWNRKTKLFPSFDKLSHCVRDFKIVILFGGVCVFVGIIESGCYWGSFYWFCWICWGNKAFLCFSSPYEFEYKFKCSFTC